MVCGCVAPTKLRRVLNKLELGRVLAESMEAYTMYHKRMGIQPVVPPRETIYSQLHRVYRFLFDFFAQWCRAPTELYLIHTCDQCKFNVL